MRFYRLSTTLEGGGTVSFPNAGAKAWRLL